MGAFTVPRPLRQRRRTGFGVLGGLALACVAACDSSFVGSSSSPSVVSCQVTTSMPAQPLAADGGRGSFVVSALPECAWQITPGSSWITSIAPQSGQGEQQVTFEVTANPTSQPRQGDIVINQQRVTISQAAAPPPPPPPAPAPPPPPTPPPPPPPAPCSFALATTTASVAAAGGTIAVGVTTGATCAWTVSTSAPWITRTSPATGVGSFVLTLAIAANNGPARTGTASVGGQVLTINQAGACTYAVEPLRFRNVDEDGQAGLTVSVTAPPGCTWTAVSNDPWITITAGATGAGSGAVVFSVAANTRDSRTGTLTVAGQTVRVDQQDD